MAQLQRKFYPALQTNIHPVSLISGIMEVIDDRVLFSRPRLLSTGIHGQVIRCEYRVSRKTTSKNANCVLKFFPPRFKTCFDRERAIYQQLLDSNTSLQYVKPLGFAEWPSAKYLKTIGRGITAIENGTSSTVHVLMLEYEESSPLSSVPISLALAKSSIACLNMLHQLGIVHGDISTDNILVVERNGLTDVVWIDFSGSWSDASPNQIALEARRAAEYFAHLVQNAVQYLG